MSESKVIIENDFVLLLYLWDHPTLNVYSDQTKSMDYSVQAFTTASKYTNAVTDHTLYSPGNSAFLYAKHKWKFYFIKEITWIDLIYICVQCQNYSEDWMIDQIALNEMKIFIDNQKCPEFYPAFLE